MAAIYKIEGKGHDDGNTLELEVDAVAKTLKGKHYFEGELLSKLSITGGKWTMTDETEGETYKGTVRDTFEDTLKVILVYPFQFAMNSLGPVDDYTRSAQEAKGVTLRSLRDRPKA